ncbi:hypothetical protein PHLCEN_2v3374 [Hermanssonia centrifuga]|uniref:Histidine acid phosphatase n=1 Tax=Hermanssonia centrifuga TaxID=98765 RepID=A0A2R6QIW6_9APHY|nr:hypothetical protein PHLCEN_2v3374 [Hermanssonia centrifuga]
MSADTSDASEVLGIVLMARHGDRRGFYQDPLTYTPSATSITPLGEQEEFALGNFLRSTYLNPKSPTFIGASELFNQSQVAARADAGGEGGVIFDSAIALLQGLFPPTPDNKDTLADGKTVVAPLGVESVEPNEDVSLEGFTSCPQLDAHTAAFYNSSQFLAVANAAAPFLAKLPPFLDGRDVTLVNMARALANFHEYGVFSDVDFSGIGNIAFRTMLPSVLTAFQRIANASDPLKIHYSAISYKPFDSLFNMTGVVNLGEIPGGVVSYAAVVVFEVRKPSHGSEPVLRFKFKNGTDDNTLHTYNLKFPGWSGKGDVPLSTFLSAFEPAAINTTTQWCNVCGQTTLRGCADLKGVPGPPTSIQALLEAPSAMSSASAGDTSCIATYNSDRISPVGAGFLGAGLSLAVVTALIATLMLFGLFSFGSKKSKRSNNDIVISDLREANLGIEKGAMKAQDL